MTNDELILIRNKQSDLAYKISQLEEAKNKILELEQDPKMREYFSLISFVRGNNEKQMYRRYENDVDKILSHTNLSNKLLYDYGEILVRTFEDDDPNIDDEYSMEQIYRDLETKKYYYENIDEIEVIPPQWTVVYSMQEEESDKKYYVLREYFIKELQTKSQEEVVEDVIKRDNNLVKRKIK